MKKLICGILVLAMCVAMFAACSKDEPKADKPDNTIATAKELLYTMYKDASESTNVDYKLVGQVTIAGTVYTVDWTADSDTIKFTRGDDKMVAVDIDEQNPEDLFYKLTATITDADGKTETVTFNRKVPAAIIVGAGMSYEEIVEAAYKLEENLSLEDTVRLYGQITSIDTAYSADYKNITVTIQIGDLADKKIQCYRLKGEGAENLKVGDYITVEGKIKNYKGTIEFDAGCVLLGQGEIKDQSELLDLAYALASGQAMTNSITLVGVISAIDTPYDSGYKNVTVTMVCGGDKQRPIMCYRMKGEGADNLAIGDTITVSGTVKNYNGTIEFDAGCVLDKLVKGTQAAPTAPADPKEIVDAAYALAEGASLPYSATLTGAITKVDTPWDEGYKNITVSIAVAGKEDKPIMCFRLKGEGANTLAVGMTITVTGSIKNYGGVIEFNSGCTLDKIG